MTHSEMPATHAAASAIRSPQRQLIGEERRPRPLEPGPAGTPGPAPACEACGENIVLIRVSGTCAVGA